MSNKSDEAVSHILTRMQHDGHLAYLLGVGTRSFELLTEAYAETHGIEVEKFRQIVGAKLPPKPADDNPI